MVPPADRASIVIHDDRRWMAFASVSVDDVAIVVPHCTECTEWIVVVVVIVVIVEQGFVSSQIRREEGMQ